MSRPEYRSVEGKLYALGRPPEVSGTKVHLGQNRPSGRLLGAVGTPPREAIPRLDLHLAVRRLPDEDVAVIRDHYILGRPRRGMERKRAVEHLLDLLDDAP